MIKQTLSDAWHLYRERFWVIALVVVTIWIPCNLIDSYFTYFIIDPDNIRASIKLTQFLENFFGIIATAGVTYIVLGQTDEGRKVGYGEALGIGFKAWGRMWITRFLFSIAVIFGLVLLVIPGVYLGVRFSFAESAVVAEGICGPAALRRSFELTRGRFWSIFWLLVLTVLILLVPFVLLLLLFVLIPALDHWVIDALLTLPFDVAAAFAAVVLTAGYRTLRTENEVAV